MKALGFNKMRVLFAKLKALWGSPFISLQMDLWTSSHQHAAYGALTCSIVDEYYDLHNLLLDISPFPEARHTGENIAAWLRGVFENYGLTTADRHHGYLDASAYALHYKTYNCCCSRCQMP